MRFTHSCGALTATMIPRPTATAPPTEAASLSASVPMLSATAAAMPRSVASPAPMCPDSSLMLHRVLDDADDVALGIGELRERHHAGYLGYRHDGLATQALDLVELGLGVGDGAGAR